MRISFVSPPARLQGVDVEDDELRGPAAAERGVGEDAGEGERRRDLALVLDALEGARGEEGEDLKENGGVRRAYRGSGEWEEGGKRGGLRGGCARGGLARVKEATNIFGRA